MENNRVTENKQLICDLLLGCCRATRYLGDMVALKYDAESEVVTATFQSGFGKKINAACESGFAMMKDILNRL